MKTAVTRYYQMGQKDLCRYLPRRKRETHKGDYGKVLLLCGSTGFTGAARLAAKAAMRTGSGLVFLGVPAAVYPIVAGGLEEPVVFPLPCDEAGRLSSEAIPVVRQRMQGIDAILAGPGLGQSSDIKMLVRMLLRESQVPLLLDADGINVLRGHIDVWDEVGCPVVLTPHDGEFARIYAEPAGERAVETVRLARRCGGVVLRKGYRTLISDGQNIFRNTTGNPGMAKGGSGDVLSGIIVSLLGQGIPPLEAAALGAWIHGAAGDQAAKRFGEHSMLPTDLIDAIPEILKKA